MKATFTRRLPIINDNTRVIIMIIIVVVVIIVIDMACSNEMNKEEKRTEKIRKYQQL